ncbi:17361_t:CDS:2, partial [Gigaspora rosea]
AADWYKEERRNISYWKTENEDETERSKSFYYLLVEQFAPLEKQHCWQLDLNFLTQQENKKVDTYATKFKRLLNHVNTNNCFPDAYVVRMFLGGLKGINAALTKPLNYCKISLENNEQSREMYNLESEPENPKILKRPDNPNWNYRLRDRKLAKTHPILEEGGRSEMGDVNTPIDIE